MDASTRERYQHLVGAYREAKARRTLRSAFHRLADIAMPRGSEVNAAAQRLIAGVGRDILATAGFGETDIGVCMSASMDEPEKGADALVAWFEGQARCFPVQTIHHAQTGLRLSKASAERVSKFLSEVKQ